MKMVEYTESECEFCRCESDCPNLLGYLTHEFVHIVEKESNVKIMPEDFPAYYWFVGKLMKQIFRDELARVGESHSL